MARILFVLPEYPYPSNSGSRMRTARFIQALAPDNELILLAGSLPPRGEDGPGGSLFDRITCMELRFPKQKGGRLATRLRVLSDLARGRSWESRLYDPEFEQAIVEIAVRERVDAILCRYMETGQYLVRLASAIDCPVVLDLDDVQPIKNARDIRVTTRPLSYARLRRTLNNAVLAREHRRLAGMASVIVCTRQDAEYITARGWSDRAFVVPNGIEIGDYDSVPSHGDGGPAPKTFIFCGHLAYGPNHDGLVWFIENVWPRMVDREPDSAFLIVGREPPEDLRALADGAGIRIHADVSSVVPFYAQAAIAVVPLRFGGGTRLKILEAFASRRPVVTTTLGAEGLGVADGRQCLIADDEVAFADACLRLLTDAELAARIAGGAYDFVRENYDARSVEEDVRRLFGRILAGAGVAETGEQAP